MGRHLAILVFAIAAGAAAAAGSGVVVAPHVDPPGTPPWHTHVLAAYRLPIFLGVLRARFDVHQGLMTTESVFDLGAGLALALLAFTWPRLPRPRLLPVADLARVAVREAEWSGPRDTGPPRHAPGAA